MRCDTASEGSGAGGGDWRGIGLLASFLSADAPPLLLLLLEPEAEPEAGPEAWVLVGLIGLAPCSLRPNRRGTDSVGHAPALLFSLSLPLPLPLLAEDAEAEEEEEAGAVRALKGEGKRFTTFCFVGRAAALLGCCSLIGAEEEVGVGFDGLVGFSCELVKGVGLLRLVLLLLRRARRRSSAAHSPLPLPVTRL